MTLQVFDEVVKGNPFLKVLGLNRGDTAVIVRGKKYDRQTLKNEVWVYEVPLSMIKRTTPRIVESYLFGNDVLGHLTRIVGYFSQVKNWNFSKEAELRDRQEGNYSLSGHK